MKIYICKKCGFESMEMDYGDGETREDYGYHCQKCKTGERNIEIKEIAGISLSELNDNYLKLVGEIRNLIRKFEDKNKYEVESIDIVKSKTKYGTIKSRKISIKIIEPSYTLDI